MNISDHKLYTYIGYGLNSCPNWVNFNKRAWRCDPAVGWHGRRQGANPQNPVDCDTRQCWVLPGMSSQCANGTGGHVQIPVSNGSRFKVPEMSFCRQFFCLLFLLEWIGQRCPSVSGIAHVKVTVTERSFSLWSATFRCWLFVFSHEATTITCRSRLPFRIPPDLSHSGLRQRRKRWPFPLISARPACNCTLAGCDMTVGRKPDKN